LNITRIGMAVKAVGCDAIKHLDHGPHTKQEAQLSQTEIE